MEGHLAVLAPAALGMSAITALSSTQSASYATQLAQSSAFQRSLYALGNAVQNGDLTSAGSILSAFIKSNPQYASTASDGSPSQDPINQGFQALADAISGNQPDDAKAAWSQLKSALAQSGVTDISDGSAATTKLIAQTKDSISQQILTDAFSSSSGDLSLTSLLGGGSSGGAGSTGLPTSVLNDWLTYQSGGKTASSVPASSSGQALNATA